MLPAELSLNRGRVLDISVYNHIKCYYSNRFGVGAVQLSLCLPKRTEARFKLFGCVNSHSFLEINAMPNFARSESDPPCLLTRHQSNLPHDSVQSCSGIFHRKCHVSEMEFSYRNTLPLNSDKIIIIKNRINFNFSIETYFRTFWGFIIKFISISKCFLFYFAKNISVYIIFF